MNQNKYSFKHIFDTKEVDYSTYPIEYYNLHINEFCNEFGISDRDRCRLLDIRSTYYGINAVNDNIKTHLKCEHGIEMHDCLNGNFFSEYEKLIIDNCTVIQGYRKVITQSELRLKNVKIEIGQILMDFKEWFDKCEKSTVQLEREHYGVKKKSKLQPLQQLQQMFMDLWYDITGK